MKDQQVQRLQKVQLLKLNSWMLILRKLLIKNKTWDHQ